MQTPGHGSTRRRAAGSGAARALVWAALLRPLAAAPPTNASNASLPAPGVPSPPLLQLGPKAVDLAWHRPTGPAESVASYEVLVTIQRARNLPVERIERSAGHETQFEFSPIPSGARTCFRVRAVGPGDAPARSDYSGETCYSNCECESALPPAGGKGAAPSPSPARPPVPKPPRPAAPDAPARGNDGGGGSAEGECATSGAPTFLAGLVTGAVLALALSAASWLTRHSDLRRGVRLFNGGRGSIGRSPFGAKPVDEAAASEYAHLTAAEQVDAQRADRDGGLRSGVNGGGAGQAHLGYGGRRGAQAGVALAELEASGASAQHARSRARAPSPPPAHAVAHYAGLPPSPANPPPGNPHLPARAPASGLPPLEPAASVDPLAFEAQWVQCQAQPALTLELRARAPRMPSPEAVESELAQSSMVCIAAGAVGEVHKAYFAAQLAPTPPGELLMLELVVSRAIGSAGGVAATATFRSLSAQHLHALSHYFGSVLTLVLGGEPFS